MANFAFNFDPADHFTTGALGVPGQRTFFLQAGRGIEFVSLICEKEQMRALGEGLFSLLDQIAEAFDRHTEELSPSPNMDLVHPVIPVWRVSQLGVGYDDEQDRVVVIVQEMVDEGEVGEVGRFTIARGLARAFAQKALDVVSGGRPSCPFCGEPLDPSGHFCPRSNGHGKLYVQ